MKQTLSKVGILLASVMLMVGIMAVPAFAQDSYTAINGDNTSVTLNKSLDLKGAEYGPSHTVKFETTGGTNTLTGATQNASGSVPDVTMSFDTTGAAQTAKLDFTGVSFPEPGIYRFEVKETDISDDAVTSKSGSETSYFVDVYVTNVVTATGVSTLQIEKYNILTGSAEAKKTSADFENEYTSYKLDVAKQVTGNQGDKTKEFTITIDFSNGQGSGMFAVKWIAGTPKVNDTAITDGNPVDVTYDANGTVQVELKLKDTDQVEFYGIHKDVEYTVVETESGQDGYTTTGEVTTAKALIADASETVVNDKQGTIPTGIFLNYKPFWIMGALALVLVAIVLRKRSRRFEDEL